jgi:hypothetical protein
MIIALVVLVSPSGLLNQNNFLGFSFNWTMPSPATNCAPYVNATYQYTITQCASYPSGEQVNPFGIAVDVVYWLALIDLIIWGSTYCAITQRRRRRRMMTSLSNWLWVIVASCYFASILVYSYPVSYLTDSYQGFPVSPWKYLALPVCTQYPGSWCYGIQSDLLLLDFFFWVGVPLLSAFAVGVIISRRQTSVSFRQSAT